MSDLFEQIKTIADLQNQAIQSGVELGRSESSRRIAFLEERNAKLLEALKDAREAIATLPIDALGVGGNEEGMRWPFRNELLDSIDKAIRDEGDR